MASSADESLLPGPVLIVEDDPPMQVRLCGLLVALGYPAGDLAVVADMADARALYDERPFALALIDIHLPDGSGIDLIGEWHEDDPGLPMLVVSAFSTAPLIVSAIQAGATGYLLKQRSDDEITAAIGASLRGGAPIDPFVARHILGLVGQDRPAGVAAALSADGFTERQIEILNLVDQGLTNKEIAECLLLSHRTVEGHIKSLYRKLAVRSRTQALFEARARGLLSRP